MTATWAILLDSYRELNARKLFWITLAISGMVVVAYASIGFDDTGLSLYFGLKHIDSEFLRAGSPLARLLYRGIFSDFIVSIWLAWIAVILALISTSSIFPDFLAGGAVELVLSKPIGRVRLFFLKYLASLLFVLLQVGLFCTGIFLCMGWRLGDWNPLIFAVIPLLALFYSYIYAVNVLVGVITRSTLAALLVSMLFWFSVFSFNATEGILSMIKNQFAVQMERAPDLAESMQSRYEGLVKWQRRVQLVQAALPKTSDTVALVSRWLLEKGDVGLMDILSGNIREDESGNFVPARNPDDREVQRRVEGEVHQRSVAYIVGTSLVFEAVVLALACFVFVRRDY